MTFALTKPVSVFGRQNSGMRVVSDGRARRAWLLRTTLGQRRTFQDKSGVACGATCIFSVAVGPVRPARGLTGLILQVTNRILMRTSHDCFWILEGMKLSPSICDFVFDAHAADAAELAP